MKKLVWVLVIGIFLLSCVSAEVRINEVMVDPDDGCNDCTEWVELYSNAETNLSGWWIADASNNKDTFNFSINGYYKLIVNKVTLNNNADNLSLYDNNSIKIYSFNYSSYSTNISWQYCPWNWTQRISTPGLENNCTTISSTNTTNTTTPINSTNSTSNNTTTTTTTNTTSTSTPTSNNITLKLEWNDEDIVYGKNISLTVRAYNLLSKKYDVKVWIEDDNGNILSDRYGNYSHGEIKWASGSYWAYNFMEGGGNLSKEIKIRIRDEHKSFLGDAKIKAIISGSETEITETIEVLTENTSSSEVDNEDSDTDSETVSNNITTGISPNSEGVIVLGKKKETTTTTTQKNTNSIIYKSKNEYIKEYIPYGFGIVCIIIILFLVFDKTNEAKRRKE